MFKVKSWAQENFQDGKVIDSFWIVNHEHDFKAFKGAKKIRKETEGILRNVRQ